MFRHCVSLENSFYQLNHKQLSCVHDMSLYLNLCCPSSSGPDWGGFSTLLFLHLGGPTDGHAAWSGHAEETPGVSSFYLILVHPWAGLNFIQQEFWFFTSLYTKCTGKMIWVHYCPVFLVVFNRPEEERAPNRHYRHWNSLPVWGRAARVCPTGIRGRGAWRRTSRWDGWQRTGRSASEVHTGKR